MRKTWSVATLAAAVALTGAIALPGCGAKESEQTEAVQEQAEQQAETAQDQAAAAQDQAQAQLDYVVEYGTSAVYQQADIDAAMQTVMAEFNNWKGCTMKRLAFTDDETCANNLAYANELRKEGEAEYDQAMVLVSDFHSPSAADAEGTAWEPDKDYNDYQWVLARTANGPWTLLTWGYA